MHKDNDKNFDKHVISDFGLEWKVFSYENQNDDKFLDLQFAAYTKLINFLDFSKQESSVADFGAGSGRWTSRLLPYFGKVFAVEPSVNAMKVLNNKFAHEPKVELLFETIGDCSIKNESLDLAISLGVIHHLPDPSLALRKIGEKLKPGAVLLCYLYYDLENKKFSYKFIFKLSNLGRKLIAMLPFPMKFILTQFITLLIYFPLARFSGFLMRRGIDCSDIPLHQYANLSFKMMANDSLDRFGTRLEHRFSKANIIELLNPDIFDLGSLKFSQSEPYWTFIVNKITNKD